MSTEWIGVIGGGFLLALGFLYNRVMAVKGDIGEVKKDIDSKPDYETMEKKITKEIKSEIAPQKVEIKNIKETTDRIETTFNKFVDESKDYQKETSKKIDQMHGMMNARSEERIKT